MDNPPLVLVRIEAANAGIDLRESPERIATNPKQPVGRSERREEVWLAYGAIFIEFLAKDRDVLHKPNYGRRIVSLFFSFFRSISRKYIYEIPPQHPSNRPAEDTHLARRTDPRWGPPCRGGERIRKYRDVATCQRVGRGPCLGFAVAV
ncbi:hypothetical protein GW17_00011933 [Ensete ventricosum]|nr:hypothetical protein GW17_00011933 [Ensete ventricosum]